MPRWGVIVAEPSAERRRAVVKWLVALVPVLLFLTLAAWTLATPVGSAPGEQQTLTRVWCGLGDRAGLCAGSGTANPLVPAAIATAGCYLGDPNVSAPCQDGSTELIRPADSSERYAAPAPYYAIMGVLASQHVAASVIAMRLVNALLFTVVGTVLCLLRTRRRAGLVLTGLLVLAPLGLFLISSVNPLSWAITGCVAAWFGALAAAESPGRRSVAAGSLAVVGVALASCVGLSFGLLALLAGVTAWAVAEREASVPPRRIGAQPAAGLIVGATAMAVIAGPAAVHTLRTGLEYGAHSPGTGLLVNNVLSTPSLWIGVFGAGPRGADAWVSAVPPYAAQASGIAILIGLLTWGLLRPPRRRVIALAVWTLVLIFWPAIVLQRLHDAVGNRVEPQQLFPAIIVLVAAAVSVGSNARGLGRAQLVLLAVGVASAEIATSYMLIRRFTVANPYDFRFDFGSEVSWWWHHSPVTPMPLWALGSLCFVTMVVVLLVDAAPLVGPGIAPIDRHPAAFAPQDRGTEFAPERRRIVRFGNGD